MKSIIITIILQLYLSPYSLLGDGQIQKHFLNAKLAYINSDFITAWEECKTALKNKEISHSESESFFELIRYIRHYTERKMVTAQKKYTDNDYKGTITVLSEILKKDSKNKNAMKLYKLAQSGLSEKERKNILNNIDKQIKYNQKVKNEAFLISLYTEKLLLNKKDEQTKLELKKVRLRYNSQQIKKEISNMIKKLEKIIKQKDFSIDESKIIVNNILYIDPNNKKALALKEILKKYKKANKKAATEIKKTIDKPTAQIKLEKTDSEEPTQTKITNFISQIVEIEKKSVKTDIINQKKKKNKAKIHFDLGINRYNKKLYSDAKEEFQIAKTYDPELPKVNQYIDICDKEEKKIERKKNREINKNIKQSKILIKDKKIEKAINLLYKNIIQKNINNVEGEKYLKTILKKNILQNQLAINLYSPLAIILNQFKQYGIHYYNTKQYHLSLFYWQSILEFFPSNKLAYSYWKKCIQKIKKPEKYINQLYEKGLWFYNTGDYSKTLFYFSLIPKNKQFLLHKQARKNLIRLKKKAKKQIKKTRKTESQLSHIYNAAILDFMSGNYSSALAKWEYILKIEPSNIKARYNLQKVNNIVSSRNTQEKTDHLSKKKNKLITQYYYQGILAYQKKKYKEAITWFNKVLKIYPFHAKAQNNINKLRILLSIK